MKSNADQGSWGLCSCVGTDRDDQGKTTPAHITDAGQGDDLLSGSRADNHSADSLLSNEPYKGRPSTQVAITGHYIHSHHQAILQGQIMQVPETGRQSALWSASTAHILEGERG